MNLARVAFLAAISLASCATATSPAYTLYRNSSLDPAARIHWASFDAADNGGGSGDYNRRNCEMAVDLLRANLRKLNGGEEPVRFWCEKGGYRD
jgi:hypothetical protein